MHFQPFQRLKLKNFPGDHARGPPLSTHANTFKTRPPFANLLRNSVSNDRSYPPPPPLTCPSGLSWSVSLLDRTSPWLRACNALDGSNFMSPFLTLKSVAEITDRCREVILTVGRGTHFSGHCRCGEVTVVERFKWRVNQGMACPPGQNKLAIGEWWPLVEVPL